MKIHIVFAALLLVISTLTSCSSGSSASYEEAKMTIQERERIFPTDYLSTDGTYRQNLVGQWVLEGSIANSATIVDYKDAVLTVNYYSKTETLLGNEQFMLYDLFPHQQKKDFKLKVKGINGTSKIGFNVTGATSL